MLDESECRNSGGWFKDPFTGEDIGPDYPRAVTSKSGDKWVQPAVCFQNGSIVKISGRCWNDDERTCYKEYRGKSAGSSHERKLREPKPIKQRVERVKQENNDNLEHVKHVVKYDSECAVPAKVFATIAECDCCLGGSQIAGITYALITKHGSNVVYHVPRCVIPDAEFNRIYYK